MTKIVFYGYIGGRGGEVMLEDGDIGRVLLVSSHQSRSRHALLSTAATRLRKLANDADRQAAEVPRSRMFISVTAPARGRT